MYVLFLPRNDELLNRQSGDGASPWKGSNGCCRDYMVQSGNGSMNQLLERIVVMVKGNGAMEEQENLIFV